MRSNLTVFVLIVLHGRNISTFLPLRDYEYFILGKVEVGGGNKQSVAADQSAANKK
jgi:hypothetical protein